MTDHLDRGRKLAYCIEMMWLVYDLNELITASDYSCRLLARSAFVYLDSFIRLAGRQNAALNHPATTTLQTLKTRYKQHKALRDRQAAHRQNLTLTSYLAALSHVESLNDVTLEGFIHDAELINDAFRQQDGRLIQVSRPSVPSSFATTISAALIDGQISVTPSPLEAVSANTSAAFFTTDIQWKAATLVSIKRTVDFVDRLVPLISHLPPLNPLVKSILIAEVISFLDNLYHDESPAKEPSLAELADKTHVPIAGCFPPPKTATPQESQLRFARRKIAAHVDVSMPFADLLRLLDEITPADAHAVFEPAFSAFYQGACTWMPTRVVLATLSPVRGVLGVSKGDPLVPYHQV